MPKERRGEIALALLRMKMSDGGMRIPVDRKKFDQEIEEMVNRLKQAGFTSTTSELKSFAIDLMKEGINSLV